MHKVTFYVGLQQNNEQPVEDGKDNVHIEQFCTHLALKLGGCSMWQVEGMWFDERAKKLIKEQSVVIESLSIGSTWEEEEDNIIYAIRLLKTAIRQSTILYTLQLTDEVTFLAKCI